MTNLPYSKLYWNLYVLEILFKIGASIFPAIFHTSNNDKNEGDYMPNEIQRDIGTQSNNVLIEQVNLSATFSARSNLGMLIMQPLVKEKLIFDRINGFVWIASQKKKQLADLNHLMNMAQDPCLAGHNTNTNIIIIPEYGIPGIEGVQLIRRRLEESSVKNQIVIGGIDGLSNSTFLNLLSESKLSNHAKLNTESVVKRSKWVNSAIVFEKSAEGIHIFLQPKMLPSPLEENLMMCEGNTLLVFKTSSIGTSPPVCLLVPICFDWIGRQGCIQKLDNVTSDIIQNISGVSNALWVIAAIQHNEKPANYDFLNGTRERLTSVPWIDIYGSNACVIMANTANDGNDEDYGQSSFIYRKCWVDSMKKEPEAIFITKCRPNLQGCREHRFRENGPVIHSINFFPFTASAGRSGDPRHIFSESKLVCLDTEMNTRCINRWPILASSVGAYIKTVGDFLDYHELNLEMFFNRHCRQIDNFNVSVKDFINDARLWDEDKVKEVMGLLCRWSNYKHNCDEWHDNDEGRALEFFIICQTLIFSLFEKVTDSISPHGNFKGIDMGNNFMFVCDGSNNKDYYQLSEIINEDLRTGRVKYDRCHRIVAIGNTLRDTGFHSRGRITGQARAGSILDTPPIAFIPYREILNSLDKNKDLNGLKSELLEKMEALTC